MSRLGIEIIQCINNEEEFGINQVAFAPNLSDKNTMSHDNITVDQTFNDMVPETIEMSDCTPALCDNLCPVIYMNMNISLLT